MALCRSPIAVQLAPKRGKANEMIRMCLLVVFPALFAYTLKGDTVELKTGERIEGAFKQATAAGAVMEVGGQSITIPLEKVKAIYFGAAPSASVAGPAPPREALDALTALRSVANSGIAYRDYSQRILDARVKVDRYLSSKESEDTELRRATRVAMLEYEFAARAWLAKVQGEPSSVVMAGEMMPNPDLGTCPTVKAMIDRAKEVAQTKGQQSSQRSMGLGVQVMIAKNPVPEIWACASAQVTEAERLLAQH